MNLSNEFLETYLGGKCFALAYALHQEFDFLIKGKIEKYLDGSEYAAHFWVELPDGRALDIAGLYQSSIDLASSYGSDQGVVRLFSSSEFLEFCDVDDDDEFDEFWLDVEEAAEAVSYIQKQHDISKTTYSSVTKNAGLRYCL